MTLARPPLPLATGEACHEAARIAAHSRCRGVAFMVADEPTLGPVELAMVQIFEAGRVRYYFAFWSTTFGNLCGFYPAGTGLHPWDEEADRFFGPSRGFGTRRAVMRRWGQELRPGNLPCTEDVVSTLMWLADWRSA